MNRLIAISILSFLLVTMMLFSGCAFFGKRVVIAPNYYILDYLPATENPDLVQEKPFNKTLEVLETSLPRTYDRNQIVIKKSFMQISYFTNDLWSNRLYDAVPNLLVRRLDAYKIFRNVSRDLGEVNPDYYLESFIQNIEYVEGIKPYAFIRMELSLRDSKTQALIFTNRDERTKPLYDKSVDYLVQCFNEMIMAETDLFAQKCINYLGGEKVQDSSNFIRSPKLYLQNFRYQDIGPESDVSENYGELKVPLMMTTENPLPFEATYEDTADVKNDYVTGIMNEVMMLHQGKWDIKFGSDQNISTSVDIQPMMRTVVTPFWSELIVHIIDESQNRVRMRYDVYAKTPRQDAYDIKVNTRYSPADEAGEYDYLWILKPGNYLITVNGASPTEYKDFTTVTLETAKSYILTIVVDPSGERSVLVGAGMLESPVTKGGPSIHKGAVHANLNLASSNSVDKNNPTRSISLSSEFDNKVKYDVWPFYYSARSLFDLGLDKTTGSELRVNVDDYSLKNSLVLYPWKEDRILKNFGLYGRGDVNTHFFKSYAFFSTDKNFMKVSQQNDTLFVLGAKKLRVRDEVYPMLLKEGMGLTYRLILATNATINLRSGFGWQQDYENNVYSYIGTVDIDTLSYEYYRENPSTNTQGLESSVIISITNLLNFINLSSTFDILFPLGMSDKTTKYDSENLVSINLLRNISVDVKVNIKYNKALQDYIINDYSAFLRLSLYY